jgi:hypothetical protein
VFCGCERICGFHLHIGLYSRSFPVGL